ncbi:hypothetical protein KUTeg_001032, partial [Tegillarca granosa]
MFTVIKERRVLFVICPSEDSCPSVERNRSGSTLQRDGRKAKFKEFSRISAVVMATGLIIGYAPMSNINPGWKDLQLDVRSISRGGTGRRTVQFPLYRKRRHYGLARTIVCRSAKIHNRRGISRVSLDDRAFQTLEHTEPAILPADYLRSVNEALTSYGGHDTPSNSGRSSPTITETQSTISTEKVCWTGNTTERSSTDSTYSWDEFDKQAAKKVQYIFEEIDSVLFEQNLEGPLYIQKECQEWGSQFPHLRILGRQLISPQDVGFQAIERESSRPSTGTLGLTDVTDQDLASTQELQ